MRKIYLPRTMDPIDNGDYVVDIMRNAIREQDRYRTILWESKHPEMKLNPIVKRLWKNGMCFARGEEFYMKYKGSPIWYMDKLRLHIRRNWRNEYALHY